MREYIEDGCRLCLSTDKNRSYYSLLDLEHLDLLRLSFSLRSDLSDITVQPKHVCDECNLVINRFFKLKKVSEQNDVFVTNYQIPIQTLGIRVVWDTSRNDPEENTEKNKIANKSGYVEINHDVKREVKEEPDAGENKDKEENEPIINSHRQSDHSKETMVENNFDIDELNDKTLGDEAFKDEQQTSDLNAEEDRLPITFECNQCDKVLRTRKLLRNHLLTHNTQVAKCPICVPDRYLKEYVLNRHLRNVHKLQKDIPCEFVGCGKMFKQRVVMKTHLQMVHLKNWTLCNICGDSVRNLHYHLQTCNKENMRKNSCEVCSKTFSCKKSRDFHAQTVHETTTNTCSICCKEVKNLKSHMKYIHTEEDFDKYPCESAGCEVMFRTRQAAVKHLKRVHQGQKDQCPLCSEWLKNLPSHLTQVHQQGKKHMCNECGKVFYKGHDLKVHIERFHEGKRYNCPECGKTVSKIRDHLKSIHGVLEFK